MVSCLMGDSTALASAIVRCCLNKMIRRFLPKGTDFRKVTAAYIQRVETWINNYPREILGFETSGSLFERYVAEAA